jgi:hypothetical protein
MIVKLIDCACGKTHGEHYRCGEGEATFLVASRQVEGEVATATTLGGARLAVETISRELLDSGEYPGTFAILTAEGEHVEDGELKWNSDGDVWMTWSGAVPRAA